MASKNLHDLQWTTTPADQRAHTPESLRGRRADLADKLLLGAFRTARQFVCWFVEPLRGEDGKLHWQALLWGNGKPRW